MTAKVAQMRGAIVSVHAAQPEQELTYQSLWLLEEVSTSINTTAAGGNASMMLLGKVGDYPVKSLSDRPGPRSDHVA